MTNTSIPVFITVLLLMLTLSSSVHRVQDDTEVVRQRVLQLMVWPKYETIPSVTTNAMIYAAALNSSCYWTDINYSDRSIVVWHTAMHMYRVTIMLQAVTVNGSIVRNGTYLRSAIHCALGTWLIHDWQNPNWWFNQIEIPLQAAGQLLMLDKDVSRFELQKMEEISFRAAWWLHRPQDTGANLLDMIRVQLYRSLATDNRTGIEQSFAHIWDDIAISPLGQDGIQNDWSYHFHGQQLLSGSYGIGWVNNVFLFMLCSRDTQYQPDQQHFSVFAEFLVKGDAWMIIRNEWDWNVVGRSIARPFNVSVVNVDSNWLRYLAGSVEMNATRTELLNFADRLDDRSSAAPLLGNRHFYTSDYQVHRRARWVATVKMQSIRTQGSECTNGENVRDEHGGQGVLNLYTNDRNEYNFIFPLLDWQAINGITVEHGIPLEPCVSSSFRTIKLPFVGGVSDGQFGLAMMDSASHNLTVKRSWHFYDEAIIALASNLILTATSSSRTTLASRLLPLGSVTVAFFNSTVMTLPDGNYSFPYCSNRTSNVQWIHVSGSDIGYLLQSQRQYASLDVQIGVKTGSYSTLGPYNATMTGRMLTLGINHGVGPYMLDYAYMILPNVALESMPALIRQYDEEHVFACMTNNHPFHGAVWPSLQRASFVLWDNMTTTFSCQSASFQINVKVSDAGTYLYRETARDFTITASHPTRARGTLKVIVDRAGAGQGCQLSSDAATAKTSVILPLPSSPQLLGSSVSVTCQKLSIKTVKSNI